MPKNEFKILEGCCQYYCFHLGRAEPELTVFIFAFVTLFREEEESRSSFTNRRIDAKEFLNILIRCRVGHLILRTLWRQVKDVMTVRD